jgi:Amt family ammonium transporter
MAQAVGVVAVFAFCIVCGLAMFALIQGVTGLRVTRAAEMSGLDAAEHGNVGYPEFRVPQAQRRQQPRPRPNPDPGAPVLD